VLTFLSFELFLIHGAFEVDLHKIDLMLCTSRGGLSGPPLFIVESVISILPSLPSAHPFLFISCMQNEIHYRLMPSIQPETDREGMAMKDLITEIVQALVDQPDQVSATEIEGENTTVLELKVAKSDMGKVIGKQGRNAQALRTILSAAAGKTRRRYVLEILE
jgi:predicted RNA-binding protein YlqC (UPF0109 family)